MMEMPRLDPQSTILGYIRENGPCTSRQISEGMKGTIGGRWTSREVNGYVRMLHCNGAIHSISSVRGANLWAAVESE